MKKYKPKIWDEIYKKGGRWESDKPSKNIIKFKEYLKKNQKVLDIGCGSGRDVIYLAKLRFDSYGIDFSKVAIRKARKKYKGKNLHLFVGKAEKLPFKNEFFGAVYCGLTIYFTNIKKTFSEIDRVVKKDGLIYLVFELKRKYIKTKKIVNIIKEKNIADYIKKFKLLKKEKYKIKYLTEKGPRISYILILVLKK